VITRPNGNESVCNLASKIRRVTTDHHDEWFARTQCAVTGPEDLPTVHEHHRGNTAARVAKLAGDREKMARLKNWPEGQQPGLSPASLKSVGIAMRRVKSRW
jgi:hypothetical protein